MEENNFVSTVDTVYSVIKDKIISGEFAPGQKLSKRKMAEVTGASVSPVIEALNRLTEDGLVESKPRWGSFVTVYTKEKIEDLYMLREAIECQIVRILAKKMTDEQYRICLKAAEELDNAKYDTAELGEISRLHYRFHTMLAECTEYPSLTKTLNRCNLKWMLCVADKNKQKTSLPDDWHRQILDVVMERNPEKADAHMRAHVYDSFRDVM